MTGAHQAPSCKERTVAIDHMSEPELSGQLGDLRQQYEALRGLDLSLDLTRGKPNKEQLALSDALDGILAGDYCASNGIDTRNYAGLEGLEEARELFAQVLDTPPDVTYVGGNASLSMMYATIECALGHGLRGPYRLGQ